MPLAISSGSRSAACPTPLLPVPSCCLPNPAVYHILLFIALRSLFHPAAACHALLLPVTPCLSHPSVSVAARVAALAAEETLGSLITDPSHALAPEPR